MKIYANRQFKLDRIVGKDVWVKASIDNAQQLTSPWNRYAYFWVRIFPYKNPNYYKIKIHTYIAELYKIKVTEAEYRKLNSPYLGEWFVLEKSRVHIAEPVVAYSTAELFEITNQPYGTYGGVNHEDLRR